VVGRLARIAGIEAIGIVAVDEAVAVVVEPVAALGLRRGGAAVAREGRRREREREHARAREREPQPGVSFESVDAERHAHSPLEVLRSRSGASPCCAPESERARRTPAWPAIATGASRHSQAGVAPQRTYGVAAVGWPTAATCMARVPAAMRAVSRP